MLLEGAAELYRHSNLTPHQLLVWFGQKLHPEVPLYNVAVGFTLWGKIDPDAFRAAFRQLIASSDALRTVVDEIDGVPHQRPVEDNDYELEYVDCSGAAPPEQACNERMRARVSVPLDMSRRLFDAALFKVGDEKYVWYFNQHHIICDGVSIMLAYNHLAELYSRALTGTLDDAAPLPRSYDHIDYELERQHSPRQAETEAYWHRKLMEDVEPMDIYGPRPRRTMRIERLSIDLGLERRSKLRAIASDKAVARGSGNLAIFSLIAAALYAYLYRASRKNRLSIGVPFHNRAATPFKDVLGLIMKVVPLQIAIERGDTFLAIIEKIHSEMSAIRPYRNVTLANSPAARVYDVWLNYFTTTYPDFCGMPVRNDWLHPGFARDALALQVRDFQGTGDLTLDFDLHCDVFEEQERREVIRHFLKVFDTLLENPAARIDDISLIDDSERRLIIEDWNASTWQPSSEQTLPRLFEAAARRNPDGIALEFEGRATTYAQLNSEANRLARHLRSLGAGPETVIALAAEPSPEMLIGILGILKAGAAYLPLDPQYPRERLSYMLADSGAALVLTEKKLSAVYPNPQDLSAPAVVYMDADREAIEARPATDLDDGPAPQNLAYIIYTSGSTGAPKGVMIEHAAVCNRLKWGVDFYRLNETDRVLQKASFAFDASVWEIFEPLIAGGRIVMAKPRGRIDVEYLADLIAAREVTVAEVSPSLLRALLDDNKLAACTALKRVFSGGEVLPPDVERDFFTQSRAELYNTYGPTETSIDVTHWKCGGEAAENVPIGRPVAGMRVYILDERMEPVPPGMPGELCIGGVGVARGYLNAPELTAEKFVPDPFSSAPGARLYKSGDLARHRRDGAIEFLGRKDNQVKVRGFRIEPGEIEAALRSHPAIRQAAVVPRENGRGDSRLAAYVVAVDHAPPAEPDLRRFLRARLPEYMVPRSFVFLESIPMTRSGKVDRLALPSPYGDSQPATPKVETVESRVTEIWESLLGVHPIAADENFFDIGGDSLSAIELMRRIEQAFGERLPLSTFLGGPTIKDMAAALVRQRTAPDRSLLVKVQAGDGKPPFFFLHGDFFNGGGFYTINMARHIGADRPFYALAPHGLNGTAVPPTVEAMADDFIELLRAVQPHGPYYVGGFCSGGSVAYEIARRLELAGERVALVVVIAIPARTAFYHRALRAIGGAGTIIGLGARQRVNFLLRARNAGLKIRRLYRTIRGAEPGRRTNRMAAQNDPLFIAYGRALTAYLPKRYAGRVLCLWPEQDTPSRRHPTAGWGEVASDLQFQLIPGAHGNCVKYHLKTIAEHMRCAILEAENDTTLSQHS